MTDKRIKNEQWSVKELISKINSQEISKPKFQRKRKWDVLPKNENIPNEKAYIQFLYDTENSVHAITFGQETTSKKICFSNIDGNNRINAIKHFIDKPFEIFNDYLDELIEYINGADLSKEDKDTLIKIFSNLSYSEVMNFKYRLFFKENGYADLYPRIQIHREGIDDEQLVKIQTKLTINNSEKFDSGVKINVNLFEGYTTDELCKTFEDINKYNSKLTETELLACQLFNESNFDIVDNIFKTELEECIKEYYKTKADGEVLNCYNYDPMKDRINAHDFIVGFQNLCNNKYSKFIDKTDVTGLSLFFKIYKALYGSYNNTFTSENINDFKEKIMYSCDIFNQIILSIFTDKINSNLFNKSCQDKLFTLKKNNMFMIISCIIGFKNKKTPASIIKKSLEKCLLYHFMVSDLKDKDKREDFKNHDPITYRAGGAFIENVTKNLLVNPEIISNKLTEELFNNLLTQLFNEENNPYERKLENGKNRNDKRRPLKFFEKTIMFYYYKEKIPTNMLENEFSIEHICPNSSEWDEELDKDRTGNLIPIISTINSSRGNKHISEYYKTDNGKSFCEFIKDIIPKNNVYDNIVSHNKKPTIISNELYNNMCRENEEKYKQNFIDCLFNLNNRHFKCPKV
jgi:hypothetical protein